MLRTARSPTADGKAKLESKQKADERPLLRHFAHPQRRNLAVLATARIRRLIGEIGERTSTLPLSRPSGDRFLSFSIMALS